MMMVRAIGDRLKSECKEFVAHLLFPAHQKRSTGSVLECEGNGIR